MLTEILIRYLHFLSILTLVAVVMGQHFMIQPRMRRAEIRRMQILDIIYGISAVVVLGTGFLQWLVVGKPKEFYSDNWIFQMKITLFLVIGLLSIYPSIFLSRQRKGAPEEQVTVPSGVTWTIRAELLLLFLMPLLATLMAKGIGLVIR